MGFIFTGAFWGVFLVLIGISVLIKVFFNIDFPIFRIFFGLLFLSIGLSILFGKRLTLKDPQNVVFGEGVFTASDGNGKYNVIFGKGETDLSGMPKGSENRVEVNTVFGENTVYVGKKQAFVIRASSAFGQIEFPDGNQTNFGSYNYTSPEYRSDKPYIRIEMNTVFGASRVVFRE